MSRLLQDLIARHKEGELVGIFAICSAHPAVLQAGAALAKERNIPLLVESTSNQVNQEGGYTGLTPADFAAYLWRITDEAGLARQQVILGGDHLGPHPWKGQPSAQAMTKACRLVSECILAGYTKIHLDASMNCVDDPAGALDKWIVARRTVELCKAAEEAYSKMGGSAQPPVYVIGTEVPPPGGAQAEDAGLQVTSPLDAEETIEMIRRAFLEAGLEAAWTRVIALVVQPGVEYSDDAVHDYDRLKAQALSRLIESYHRLVYEAHSTDYQELQKLRQLVEDHFAILKVGPALTFAFREAVYALAAMEREWLEGRPGLELSHLPEVLDQAMLSDRRDWQNYYAGDERELRFKRKYSFSDRSRYYWNRPAVQQALQKLLSNLESYPVPISLVSQFLPRQYAGLRAGRLANSPYEWILDKIREVLEVYADAVCGGQ